MTRVESKSASEDHEARSALWSSIREAGERVRQRFGIVATLDSSGTVLDRHSPLPKVKSWQLVEALSLLCIILKAQGADAMEVPIFGKCGSVRIIEEDGQDRFLWAQPTIVGDASALGSRPDIVITSSSDSPTAKNVLRIIECKCVRKLGAPTIRGEFGKAHDLRVASYLIWSFFTPSNDAIGGARKLGIDIEPIGFDSEWRDYLIGDPVALIARFTGSQEQARIGQNFATRLLEAAQETGIKLT